MNILVFDKSNTVSLLPTLGLVELKCKCDYPDCTRTLILKSSVESYERVREEFNEAIRINSGYRCQKHNWEIGGSMSSYHRIGAAKDLTPWNYSIEKLDRLEEIAKKHYDVVLRYDNFIHCHNFGDK